MVGRNIQSNISMVTIYDLGNGKPTYAKKIIVVVRLTLNSSI